MVKINQNIEEIPSKPRQARALTIISGPWRIFLEKKMFSHDLHITIIETLFVFNGKYQQIREFILSLFQAGPGAEGWTEQIQGAGGCRHAPFIF